ncbi:phage tail terminator-like protein [Microvirga antarctica]|uniref:phage tail terminator-like protein n=1 Tax=Microvirga antarctica TaxID=2819233 RepID=UPI001B30234E|nr:phage tail terminator-like protein [Microvirga antarctica]
MARKAVIEAVTARLAAQWTSCPIIPTNRSGDRPRDGSPFLVVQFPVANTARLTHSAYYREEGAFRIVIATERGEGMATPLAWADELAALFRSQRFDGVRCKTPGSPLIHDENDDGAYFVTSIVVPYFFDFQD